jgi:LysR family hca operon transcriptional activator
MSRRRKRSLRLPKCSRPILVSNFLPSSVTSRPLKGYTPTVDLVLGYKKSNESPILKVLLSRLDELVARVSKKA